MKVSYIILPFEDPTYLVRCVNSLYRQLGEDFEVILAENDFGDKQGEIEEFLGGKTQVKRIARLELPTSVETEEEQEEAESYNIIKATVFEKLTQAISLISADSDYVMLIDVDTVVSPVCTKAILKCDGSDLIIPAAAVKNKDTFVFVRPKISEFKKNFDKYVPQRLCFGKNLFDCFQTEFIENTELFSSFLLTAFANGRISITATEDVVIYVQSFPVPEKNEDPNFDAIKEKCNFIFSKLIKIDDEEAKAYIFEKVIRRVFALLSSDEDENSQKAYEVLQDYCNRIRDDFILKKVFKSMVGLEANELLLLNYEQFTICNNYVNGTLNSVTAADSATQNKLLKDMKTALDAAKKDLVNTKKEISAITARSITAATAATGTVISDPYTDIPQMYREGRLGLKTIIRSFGGWLKYKTGRKK